MARRRTAPAPMLPTLGPPPRGPGWAVEFKFDGQRAQIMIDAGEVTVFSRAGADVTRAFPELAAVAAAVGNRQVVLDGEIIAPDVEGRPSFSRLQQRWPQNRRPTAQLLRQVPVRFVAFDVLALDGHDLTPAAYVDRRAALDRLAPLAHEHPILAVPRAWTDVSPAEVLAVAAAHAMEGVVSKRLDSPYQSGRSNLWVKSPVRATAELIVVGYARSSGPGGANSIGTLLLAGRDAGGDLVVVGTVGTGFSSSMRRHLYTLLSTLDDAEPLRTGPGLREGFRWVQPVYVGEVAYREYTPGGLLRHTSWKGLRPVPSTQIGLPI